MAGVESHGAGWAAFWLRQNVADDALVLVSLLPFDAHILPKDQAGQVQLRSLTEGLSFLRSIDALKANLVLLAISVEHGDRVAISYGDHAAEQGLGVDDAGQHSADKISSLRHSRRISMRTDQGAKR